jgi:hypothetical protein
MRESIFFDDSDRNFCKSNILLQINNTYEKNVINGIRAIFLSSKNDEFKDLKLRKYAEKQEYLNYKDKFKNFDDNVCNFIDSQAINYLRCIDSTDFIKIFERKIESKRKNNSVSVKKFNEYKFFAGFDTEFISNIIYNARLNEIDDLNIEKMNILTNDDKILSYQFSLQITENLFLNTIIFTSKIGAEIDYKNVIENTIIGNLQLLFEDYKIYEDKFDITINAHKNVVDFSKVKNLVTLEILKNKDVELPIRLKGLITIRNCFITTKKMILGNYINRNFKVLGSIHLRDSLLLDEPQSLKKIGETLHFNKLEIGDNIEKMDIFKENSINGYIMYAIKDSCIAVNFLYNYYKQFLRDKETVPLTIGKEGAKYTKNFLKKVYALSDDEFDKWFRGLDTIKNGRKKVQEYKDTLDTVFNEFGKHYYGGRNETFYHGLKLGQFYDIDGSKFYPVMASAIALPDFSNIIYLESGEVTENNLDFNKFEIGYAIVDFEFTSDEKFIPCITQKAKKGNKDFGLVYTRKGTEVFTTLAEIKSAYRLGCKINIRTGMKFGEKICGEDNKYPLSLLFNSLAVERNKYPKGSPMNKFWKLIMNSITGKFGQGAKHKRVYSFIADETQEVNQSQISSPPIVNSITGLSRVTITEVMNIFINEGFKIINVVTDGFLIQTPKNIKIDEKFINNIVEKYIEDKRFPTLKIWKDSLKRLGEKNYLEIKHSGSELLSVKTRVMALLNNEDESMSQFSCTGYIIPGEWSSFTKNQLIRAFIDLVISRTGRIKLKGKKLVSAKDIRRNQGTSAKMVDKNLSFNFDFKRKVIRQTEENNYISYETTAYNTIEEFFEEKMYRETNKDIQIINVKGDMKMRLLEELRGYNFKRIDKKNEFNQLVEKFIVMSSKTKIFYINGIVKELDYDSVKGLLAIKNIEFKMDKREYGKLKLSKKISDNLDTLKGTILRQLNQIFEDEKITFSFIDTNNNILKYANLFIETDSKKEKKKKEKLKEKIEIHIAEEELKEIKYKS